MIATGSAFQPGRGKVRALGWRTLAVLGALGLLYFAGGCGGEHSLVVTVLGVVPGIEKLRLTPKDVNNGEAPAVPCRTFALLDIDEAHLNRLGLKWETLVEAERRWLLLYDYPLPAGYTVARTSMALEIPPTYPGAQIYGFYAYPPLALASQFVSMILASKGKTVWM